MSFSKTAIVGLLLVSASFAAAKPPFLKVFLNTYKISPNSDLGKAKCMICHANPAPPKRNSYGLDVEAAMDAANARMLTPEILKSIEKKDSDGDGVNNLAEIKAGTLPGDKTSKPVKTKPKKSHRGGKGAKTALFDNSGYAFFGVALIPMALLGIGRRSPRVK